MIVKRDTFIHPVNNTWKFALYYDAAAHNIYERSKKKPVNWVPSADSALVRQFVKAFQDRRSHQFDLGFQPPL